MSLFAPSYYPAFRCIAGDCRHSCCVGWEIGIDPHTLARYKALPPKERKAILSHTVTEKGYTFFRLTKEERCPFLTEGGLCRLILTHGEEILCDICREHPRFYNVFANRTEVGLGLCCEEAARLILAAPDPFCLVCMEANPECNAESDPFEADFFAIREELLALLCRRDLPLTARIDRLLARYSLSKGTILGNDVHWQAVFRKLERLDPAWDDALTAWELSPTAETDPLSVWEVPAEQLIAYFLYRHLTGALTDGRYGERVAFAILSAHVICSVALARSGSSELSTLIDTAHAYSAEVEYDEENVDAVLEEIGRRI